MTRRQFVSSLSLAGALPGYAFGLEPNWLELTSQTVVLPCLAPGVPIRILQLSDLHLSSYVPFSLIDRAISMGLNANPDLICLTGDFITNSEPFDSGRYATLLKRLSRRAPTFASLGNHDGGLWAARHIGGFSDNSAVRSLLEAADVHLLHNRSQLLSIRGRALYLAGVGDLWSQEAVPESAFASIPDNPDTPVVLLAHNPDTKELVANRPWHLMLSGHTHGGQVLIPVVGTRFVSVRDKRFISGLKKWNGKSIYITRGVGNLAGVRFNCRPEVTILDLAGPLLA